ncbi:Uncharacterized protein PBTT_08238 [Plasmodiophora brassicae]
MQATILVDLLYNVAFLASLLAVAAASVSLSVSTLTSKPAYRRHSASEPAPPTNARKRVVRPRARSNDKRHGGDQGPRAAVTPVEDTYSAEDRRDLAIFGWTEDFLNEEPLTLEEVNLSAAELALLHAIKERRRSEQSVLLRQMAVALQASSQAC